MNLQKLLEKKEENGKTSHSYDKSQSLLITKLRSVSIKMTMATHFISQPTPSTLSTDTISTPLRRHTTSEQRRICVDVTSFCNITVDTTPLRRCMLTELKQFILLNINCTLEVTEKVQKYKYVRILSAFDPFTSLKPTLGKTKSKRKQKGSGKE